MRQLKILTLITGLIISSMGFASSGGGDSASKNAAVDNAAREQDKENLTTVLGQWLTPYYPDAKALLGLFVLERRPQAAIQAAPSIMTRVLVEAFGSGDLLFSVTVYPNISVRELLGCINEKASEEEKSPFKRVFLRGPK